MELTSLLASALTDLVSNAISSASSSSNPPALLPGGFNDVSTLPLPIVPPSVSPTAVHSGSSVNIPFQQEYYGLTGGETGHASTTVPELSNVRDIIRYYQLCELVELEAVIFPSAGAYKTPLTVDLLWTPADVLAGAVVLSKPGAVRFTIGGLNITNSGALPCPLQYVNRVIKSPVSYTNSPRLNVVFHKVPDHRPNTGTSGSLVIRGVLKCSVPTVF